MDEREELTNQLIEGSRRFYHRHLQLVGDREWAEVDLTMPQLKALFVVAMSNGVTMTQLAHSVRMTLSTATGVADRLIAQCLVSRENDPGDRRLVLLHATKTGAELVDRLTQVGQDYFRKIADRLTLEELTLVARAQDLIYHAMLEIPAEAWPTGAPRRGPVANETLETTHS
ncbi:MAG: MarR family transcriptional regulator [Dehalococcoidia bacterium]|nr:MarR family transcriptional regulator [Dehalococcoidia bacterium]